jgi:25S rRNA (uracil2634-N3)-methyltransferase
MVMENEEEYREVIIESGKDQEDDGTEDEDDDDLDRETEQWMKHYSSKQRILLVGEGDFSFSICLARAFGSARNMVATSLDTQGKLQTYH